MRRTCCGLLALAALTAVYLWQRGRAARETPAASIADLRVSQRSAAGSAQRPAPVETGAATGSPSRDVPTIDLRVVTASANVPVAPEEVSVVGRTASVDLAPPALLPISAIQPAPSLAPTRPAPTLKFATAGLADRAKQQSAVQWVAVDEPLPPGKKQPAAVRPTLPSTGAGSPNSDRPKPPPRMQLPPELPGATAPPIRLPPVGPQNDNARQQAIERLFPPLPDLGADFAPSPPGAQVHAFTLAELEQIARQNSPTIRQAAADVQTAQGNAVQAGLPPNPVLAYESDDVRTGNTNGYQGGFVEQQIKTGGKLQLARASAMIDVENAQVALRKANVTLAAAVRAGYFAVLVAQENVRISHGLAKFSDEAYRVQVDLVKGGQAAAYEPLQLRVLAYQARASLMQARNRYFSAWKQLAATLGLPGMPPRPLAGRVDAAVPIVRYDSALAHVLSQHSDVITAENTLQQAQINLKLAQVMRIPDVTAHAIIQKDNTTAPFNTVYSLQISAPLPVWDRNQGNIEAADGKLMNASEGPHLARDNLVNSLADAFERYRDNLLLVNYYRTTILPDQMQAYRGTRLRWESESDQVPATTSLTSATPQFADLVTAQQTLATTVTSYVTALGSMWTAVVDLSALLEAEDLFQMGDLQNVPEVPDLEHLCPLPCCHANCPTVDPAWLGADGQWPAVAPGAAPTEPSLPPRQ